MHGILNDILNNKKIELETTKKEIPLSYLENVIKSVRLPLDFMKALQGEKIRLIAEVKKASPSRGDLQLHLDGVVLAKIYERNGASAISVLTESNYFKGSLESLSRIKKAVRIPLLRKDFIFDPYQVYESRANGADAILLITAILSNEQLRELLSLSHSLGMSCLVEVHNEDELEIAVTNNARIIGINNRDLSTFTVDIKTTERLSELIPPSIVVVSESGINSRQDMEKLNDLNINAALVGEALVTAKDIPAKVRELVL